MGEEATFCILQVPGEYPPFPGTGWQEPPHLLTGWGAQEPLGKVEKQRDPPTSRWAHSVSSVIMLGSGLARVSPWPSSPGIGRFRINFPMPPASYQVMSRF